MVPNVKDVIEAGYVKCSGCGTPTLAWTDPCWECVKARARTATNRGRCTCPAKLKRPRPVDVGHRAWLACDRCLGVIKNLPDPPRRPK
jgi:predicted amidophosphoribosyltransferase